MVPKLYTMSYSALAGIDDFEFLVNPLDNIITYRANSRDVMMAGSQVIGDGGSSKNRLDSIRRKLAVSEMGVTDTEAEYYKERSNFGIIRQIAEASKPSEINFIDNSVPGAELESVAPKTLQN
jgi:hypothetical protein